MRLIDADSLIKDLEEDEIIKIGFTNVAKIKCLIGLQRTIDAVPVTRCKDCKHWRKLDKAFTPDGSQMYFCNAMEKIRTGNVGKESYCSFGEKK